jgi:hypothetical protein
MTKFFNNTDVEVMTDAEMEVELKKYEMGATKTAGLVFLILFIFALWSGGTYLILKGIKDFVANYYGVSQSEMYDVLEK